MEAPDPLESPFSRSRPTRGAGRIPKIRKGEAWPKNAM